MSKLRRTALKETGEIRKVDDLLDNLRRAMPWHTFKTMCYFNTVDSVWGSLRISAQRDLRNRFENIYWNELWKTFRDTNHCKESYYYNEPLGCLHADLDTTVAIYASRLRKYLRGISPDVSRRADYWDGISIDLEKTILEAFRGSLVLFSADVLLRGKYAHELLQLVDLWKSGYLFVGFDSPTMTTPILLHF
jgi:hypothetical protein